jgi:hypothetical protein
LIIEGESNANTKIYAKTINNMFEITSSNDSQSLYRVEFRDLCLRGACDDGATISECAIYATNTQFVRIMNCVITRFGTGIKITGDNNRASYFPVVEDCDIDHCTIGIYLGDYANCYNISRGRIRNASIGLQIFAGTGTVYGTDFENNVVGCEFNSGKPKLIGSRFEYNEKHLDYKTGFYDGMFIGNSFANPSEVINPLDLGFRAFMFGDVIGLNTSNKNATIGGKININNSSYKNIQLSSNNSSTSTFTIKNTTDDKDILTFAANGLLKSDLKTDGIIDFTTSSSYFIMTSPNGTRYNVTIQDDGTLKVSKR